MPHRRYYRFVAVVSLTLLGSSLVLGWSLSTNQRGNDELETTEQRQDTDTLETVDKWDLPYKTVNSTTRAEVPSIGESTAPKVYLVSACPDPSAELTYECMATLDDLFTDKKIGHLRYLWITFKSQLTYGQIYFDPIGDRERVAEALDNPSCNLTDENDVRWDLYDECHADSFARHFHFTRMCLNPEYYKSRYYYWFSDAWDPENKGEFISRFDRRLSWIDSLPLEKRATQINDLWEETLESRWIVNECEQFNVETILIDPTRDQELFDKLRSAGRLLKVNDRIGVGHEIRESLQALAARFGEAWAVITHEGSPAWRTYRAEQYPWIHTNQKLFHHDASREAKLFNGVEIAVELAESGLDFDWDYLVSHICTDQKDTDSINCQTAINALRAKLDPIEEDKLLVLGQIEQKSIELGVYDQTSIIKP